MKGRDQAEIGCFLPDFPSASVNYQNKNEFKNEFSSIAPASSF